MNKENKKKFYDILNNNLITPTPQQRTTTTTKTSSNTALTQEITKQKQQNNNNNKKSTYEQQQEQRRRLLEEFRRKKEVEKQQNKQNNKLKLKPIAQKKVEREEKHLSKRTITKVESKNANAYSSPFSSLDNNKKSSDLDKYQTPIQNPVSPKKSVSSIVTASSALSPRQQHQNTSLESMVSLEEVKGNNSFSINQSTEKVKSELDNDTERTSQKYSLIHSKSPASGKPQRVKMEVKVEPTTSTDEIVNNNSPSLSRVEHQRNNISPLRTSPQRVVSRKEFYGTPTDSPLKTSSPYRRKRLSIQPNSAILSFGKAQRMKKDSAEPVDDIVEERVTPIPTLSTTVISATPQVPQTSPSTALITSTTKKASSGNNIQRSKFISEYDNSEDNATSSFECISSPTILLPKLKRLTPKRSPSSNPAIASFGKAQRIKIVKDDDYEDVDFLTPKASDYTGNIFDTTKEKDNNDDGFKARNFFSILASTPFNEIISEPGRLLDFSRAEGLNTDSSFIGQKDDKFMDEFMFMESNSPTVDDQEIFEIQQTNDSPKAKSPFLKDVSIQTSPNLLARFLNQLKSQEDHSNFDFTKWTKHYVLSIYDPKTYSIKYTEVVPIPTISLFYIKDAVRVAETGSELLARAMFYILEADWPPHSKKIGILVDRIPPREKARYWIERARFEERCMHYEEALKSYEKAQELNAKPIELVNKEREKFLTRLCHSFNSSSSPRNDLSEYDHTGDNLSLSLEYESGINYYNNKLSEQSQSSSSIIQEEDVEDIAEYLDNLSIDIKNDDEVIKNKNSIQETPDSFDSSLTLLTSVKAKKKEREEMGVEKVVTPVRRSARIHKSSHPGGDRQTPEDQKIAMLLEENGFAYVPNPALFYNKNLTPLKKSTKKNDDIDNAMLEKPKPVSGKKTVTWEDLKKNEI